MGLYGFVEDGGVSHKNIGFDEISIRQRFIRKVFSTVMIMLAVVAAMSSIPYIYKKTSGRDLLKANSGLLLVLYITSYVTFLVVYITLICYEHLRRSYPINVILTGILTVAIGFMTMMICMFHEAHYVMLAILITMLTCGAVALFACQTKYDFTSWIGVVYMAFIGIVIFGLVAITCYVFVDPIAFKWMYLLYCFIMVAFLLVFFAIDIQMLMGGKTVEVSPDDHIFISIQLFLDVIYIFWYILRILGLIGDN